MEIRKLKSDEIECRVAQCGKNDRGAWCSILLYKDARVDQRILDETFGIMGWKRSHELIGDRLYCTVSVWDNEKKEWISKQDVGTESNTEKEKGQASDAFKRACFNIGIGRELYTAPKIFISLDNGEYTEKSGRISPKISLDVQSIGYDDQGRITSLVLTDARGNVRYTLGGNSPEPEQVETQPVPAKKTLVRGGKAWQSAVMRLASGEPGLMDRLRDTYSLTEEDEGDLFDAAMDYRDGNAPGNGNNQTNQ